MAPLKVEKTTNYAQFKVVYGNRVVSKKHVSRIRESITHKNLLPYQPIMVNEKKFVIDGQHRLQAAKELGIDIYYIVVPNTDINDVRFLNSYLKAWHSRDFAESFAEIGNKHYKKLLETVEKTEIPLLLVASIYMGKQTKNAQSMTAILRDGEFEIKDEPKAMAAFDKIEKLRPYTEGDTWKHGNFIVAFFRFISKGKGEDVMFAELMKKLRTHGKRLRKYADVRDYIYQFSEIYNMHKSANLMIPAEL